MNSANVYYHVRNPMHKCRNCGKGILTVPTNSGTCWCPVCKAEHDREYNLVEDSDIAKTTGYFRK